MNRNVLIIDDDKAIINAIKILLESEGWVVFDSSNCRDGLKICAHEQPKLVILDVYLKGSTLGLEVAKEIAKDHLYYGNPKIIVISGEIGGAISKSENFKRENNIDLFLEKPLNFKEFLKKINGLFESN